MTNGNRFYVRPGNDFSSGLTGLAGAIKSKQKEKEDQEAKDRIDAINRAGTVALQSGDPQQVSDFVDNYPKHAQAIMSAFKFKNEGTKQNYIESLVQGIQNPEMIPQIAEKRQAYLKTQGLTAEESIHTDNFVEDYYDADNPAESAKALELELSFIDNSKWKTIKEQRGETGETRTADVKNYEYAASQGYDGSFLDYQSQGKDTTGGTTAIKEFEYAEKNPAFKAAQLAKEDGKKTKEKSKGTFEDSSKLRKEFLDQSKEYQKVRDSYTRVIGSTQEPSPAGDLSLIFNYMKMLDPGSVVRESEFATAASTGSYGQRIQASVQKVLSGERLAPKMREDFVSKASVLLKGMQDQHKKREKSYTGIAEKNNLPVNEVVVDITAPGEQYKEGQTATGKNGEKIIFSNGAWVSQ